MIKDEYSNILFDLYVLETNRYLIQIKGGQYRTKIAGINKTNRGQRFNVPQLSHDDMIKHVNGSKTVGVFATNDGLSKFMTFDVDFENNMQMAKWVTYKLHETLVDCGVNPNDIHVSFSGNKGYHIDLLFNEPMNVKTLKQFYVYVLEMADLLQYKNKIEFRPDKQGIKLPLCKNQKTGKWCKFRDPLNVDVELGDEYVKTIVPMDVTGFMDDVIERMNDEYESDEQIIERAAIELQINELESYGIGIDENKTVEHWEKVFRNGIPALGSRHMTTFNLARFLKSHYGMNEEEGKAALLGWLAQQDTRLYDSTYEDAARDTVDIVEKVWRNDKYVMIARDSYVTTVYPIEVRTILLAKKNEKTHFTPKQKNVMFAMLIHSKRYKDKSNRFFMTYEQIKEATGMVNDNQIKKTLDEMESRGFITIHQRNTRATGKLTNTANVYEINFEQKEKTDTRATNTDNGFTVTDIDHTTFTRVVNSTLDKSEFKSLLPRRQFESIFE